MGDVQPTNPCRTVPISDRSKLVLGKSIRIKCCPVAKQRQAIGKVEGGAAVPRFPYGSRDRVSSTENAFEIGMRCKGCTLPGEDGCKRKPEFHIRRRLKAEPLA